MKIRNFFYELESYIHHKRNEYLRRKVLQSKDMWREKGVAFVEFTLVLPLMLLLILSVYLTCQGFVHSLWYIQTVYQAAYLGAETEPGVIRRDRSQTLMRRLEGLHNFDNHQRNTGMQQSHAVNLQENSESFGSSVIAQLAGSVKSILPSQFLGLNVSMKAPVLISGSSLTTAPVFSGSNADGSMGSWDCCGISGTASQCVEMSTNNGRVVYAYTSSCARNDPGSYPVQ
jgi:hypothetical protein